MAMDILASLKNAVCVSGICFLLYKTDFIIHYLKLFRLDKLVNIWDYCFYKASKESSVSFLEYLKITKPNFFTSLIGCPFCLGFWIALAFCGLTVDVFFCYWVYVLLYKVINKI
jgi:hypothetical protein